MPLQTSRYVELRIKPNTVHNPQTARNPLPRKKHVPGIPAARNARGLLANNIPPAANPGGDFSHHRKHNPVWNPDPQARISIMATRRGPLPGSFRATGRDTHRSFSRQFRPARPKGSLIQKGRVSQRPPRPMIHSHPAQIVPLRRLAAGSSRSDKHVHHYPACDIRICDGPDDCSGTDCVACQAKGITVRKHEKACTRAEKPCSFAEIRRVCKNRHPRNGTSKNERGTLALPCLS
jgi:hypothetical protein